MRYPTCFAVLLFLLHAAARSMQAQPPVMSTIGGHKAPTTASDFGPSIHRTFAIVRFVPPFFLVAEPKPPRFGYFGWKVSFGDAGLTAVLRPDSVMSTRRLGQTVKASRLFLCETPDTPILDCQVPIAGRARLTSQTLELEISDTAFVNRIRRARPVWAARQSFEPGGRFFVDRVSINYH